MVSREDMVAAFMDAEALLHVAGGTVSVLPQRRPTDIDGEMVTVGAIFEWRDRTDARPQPERATQPAPAPPAPEPEPKPASFYDGPPLQGEQSSPDGLDETQLEDEDVSSIPVAAR